MWVETHKFKMTSLWLSFQYTGFIEPFPLKSNDSRTSFLCPFLGHFYSSLLRYRRDGCVHWLSSLDIITHFINFMVSIARIFFEKMKATHRKNGTLKRINEIIRTYILTKRNFSFEKFTFSWIHLTCVILLDY